MEKRLYPVTGFEMQIKTVGKGPKMGRVYLPKKWAGKDVAIILKELPGKDVKHG